MSCGGWGDVVVSGRRAVEPRKLACGASGCGCHGLGPIFGATPPYTALQSAGSVSRTLPFFQVAIGSSVDFPSWVTTPKALNLHDGARVDAPACLFMSHLYRRANEVVISALSQCGLMKRNQKPGCGDKCGLFN